MQRPHPSASALLLRPGWLLAATALAAACQLPSNDYGVRAKRPSALPAIGIAAHRGASESRPENTLAAFREAARLGVHQIEFDIRATKDGQLVVMHDATVDRTTSGSGRVSQLTLDEIRPLDAGSWKDRRYRGEHVPTLVEALRVMPRNIWINLHIKDEAWVAEEVALVVVEENRVDQAILSVDADGARLARQVDPALWICDMDRKLTRGAYIDGAIAMKADFIQLTSLRGLPSVEEVMRAKRGGLRVNYCCEKDATRVPGLFALGIDFPMLNDVEGAMQAARLLEIPPPGAPPPLSESTP